MYLPFDPLLWPLAPLATKWVDEEVLWPPDRLVPGIPDLCPSVLSGLELKWNLAFTHQPGAPGSCVKGLALTFNLTQLLARAAAIRGSAD